MLGQSSSVQLLLTLAEAKGERQLIRQAGEKAVEKVAASFLLVVVREKEREICFETATAIRLRVWMDAQI